jgi:hypothetical protein
LTRFNSASRKQTGDTAGDARGCRSNLAKAEGLKPPSPRKVDGTTITAYRSSNNGFALQPLSVQGFNGMNLAVGLAEVELKARN